MKENAPVSAGESLSAGRLGQLLLTSKWAQAGELLLAFVVPSALISGAGSLVGDNPWALQGVIAFSILLTITLIWLGLRLRGQGWSHFGLRFGGATRRTVVRSVLLSLLVFLGAMAAFLVGSIVMMNLVRDAPPPDTSSYDRLKGNLPLVLLTLLSVYVTASFGEEVIYRGFLINRIAELGSGRKGARVTAVLISSVVFGLIHYQWGATGMVQTGFMGLALGMSYLWVQRNLWVTILAHAYMDTILILQMY